MSSEASILWGLLFGAVGIGYFVYGKRQRKVVPLICGLGLMVIPYFLSNAWLLVLTGVVIATLPYFVRL